MFETTNQKSQNQSDNLRPDIKSLGLSLKNETGWAKSWSQSRQNVDHRIFINLPWKCLALIKEQTFFIKVGLKPLVSRMVPGS